MARTSAADRVTRILAVIPWVEAQGRTPIATVCERFSVSTAELLSDLAVVPFVGRYPYTPDTLIDVLIDDDHIEVVYGNYFRQPLRLTKIEALALLAAGQAAAAHPGNDPDGPLARAVAKIGAALEVDLDSTLGVVLEGGPRDLIEPLQRAVDEAWVVTLDYYSQSRNAASTRAVEPHRLFHAEGAWYLDAFCRNSDDDRLFRVDRITGMVLTDEHFAARPVRDDTVVFSPDPDTPRVTLAVDAEARWIIEQYPVEAVDEVGDGVQHVTLAVTNTTWLERLLLRLGPHATVVDGPEGARDAAVTAAARLLSRYRS